MEDREIRQRVSRLRQERRLVEEHCLSIGEQMGLWVSQRYTRCGKAGCKCMRGEGHGPFWYGSYKEGGRLTCRYLGAERLKKIRHAVENYRVP